MKTLRLETFSDAVIAIIMTIMVLELHAPDGTDWAAVQPLLPVFFAYGLSFMNLAIFWNNHHHMIHATDHVDGRILWANMHLLFWMSLVPFATAWLTEHGLQAIPTAFYGAVLFFCAFAYFLLQTAIIAHGGANAELKNALGKDVKGKSSVAAFALSVLLAFIHPWLSIGLFVFVTLLWFVPDRRIEQKHRH